MKLQCLLETADIIVSDKMRELEVSSIEEDSREVTSGSLFIAVTGFDTDGHRYVVQALERGAAAVIVEHDISEDPRVIVNPAGDNRKLLADISAKFFDYPWNHLISIGITGTNGKTSTTRMLAWILEKHDFQTGLIGTVGHLIGGRDFTASMTTPGALELSRMMNKMVTAGDRCCVMEVSSHALALARVDSVRFDVGLFTNISQDHLDFHESMDKYLRCKMHLFDLLKPDGSAIIGTYSSGFPSLEGADTFGTSETDTFLISEISVGLDRISFELSLDGIRIPVRMDVAGRFNVFNAAGALAAAVKLGIDPYTAAESLHDFRGVPGRFESVDLGQDFLVAIDYAHTPDALKRILQQASELTENRVIVVFGAGGDRDASKRPLMGRIADNLADIIVITCDNPRTEDPDKIIQDILAGISQGDGLIVEPDRRTAIGIAIQKAVAGDVVIIAGKGHEDYQILGKTKIHFDDREEASAALRKVLK
ncbi:MAG: UDP-N-acetylmuramoyl-L-alanyl-D-glutamate--2,6-diaminopimelate ligase [Candidatus Fermentibacteraceae bacterium]|nr:UDP-N-acetylmuramoyl-L-alanyl-D-glutamate--2,6-diaminopimelate ligase [Candidatus Fermentibacteraceae bacterium]